MLFGTLKTRFERHPQRHPGMQWAHVQARLEADADKLWSLHEMERTGGEPDVIGHEEKTGEYCFVDCSTESPTGHRSICYDWAAMEAGKENKPESNVVEMAVAMGIEILTEAPYRELQQLGDFDTKTSSWVQTPVDIRKPDGALFCDRRYGRVFVYHNGVQSYYAASGFRGALRV
ncbi:DUF4256 domain-containing protein [Chitiniphilus purpureus]|uniref:DUF4256 domain-containing protein n=1 Tax=Chitiniphilus purpureus TaxID=2981137 RepID=A0ABY6DM89_9NEIS|nr:DUF4256 domain-containing protein [Chitiniphilus sp. CD1]UXY15490.1 DUF4256 domain-containing protein [Chitiniphilus sp. CD1]